MLIKKGFFLQFICLSIIFTSQFAVSAVADFKHSDKMKKAMGHYFAGQLNQAEPLFTEIINSQNSLSMHASFFYGKALTSLNRHDEAEKLFRKVVGSKTNGKLVVDAQFELGQLSLKKKNYKEARDYFKKNEKRSRREEIYPEVIYYLALAEREAGNNSAYCKWVKKLYVSYPQFGKIAAWGPSLSENQIEGKKTNCSSDPESQKKRIKNLQWAGMMEKARAEVNLIRKDSPEGKDFEADRFEVAYLLHEGEVAKALAILTAHYETQKTNFSYLTSLGNTAARAGELQTAIGSYYSAYKLAPKSRKGREALYHSAFLSYQFQDYDGAAKRFKEFIKAYSGSALAKDARWHLAWLTYLRGDYEAAHKEFKNLLTSTNQGRKKRSSFPTDRVTYWMAMSLFKQKKYQEAQPLFAALAADKQLGYYSLVSQNRLNKMLPLMAKEIGSGAFLKKQVRTVARFSDIDSVIPQGEIDLGSEEDKSEENLSLNTVGDEELAGEVDDSSDSANGSEQAKTTTDADGEVESESDENPVQTAFSNPALVQKFERAHDLVEAGLSDWAKWDLFEIEKRTSNRDYLKTLMENYLNLGVYNRSSYISQIYFASQRAELGLESGRQLWMYSYPRAYEKFVEKAASQFSIPEELIWGIMRTESNFKPDAISPVGALGLMQVMPTTGSRIAELISDKSFQAPKLLEPEVGIRIGSRYLQRLMRKFNNNVPLVAAAYNAGPHRVKLWLSSFGALDVDEFVEHIPFLETRNYVKKVVASYHVYSKLYNQKQKSSLVYLTEPVSIRFTDPVPTKETWEDI